MIRTILIPRQKTISFDIPESYVGKELEVIAFSTGEGMAEENAVKKQVSFNAISIDTRGFKFNRDEANKR
jgi:hypothetical protein